MKIRVRLLFHEHFDRDQVYLGLRIDSWAKRIPLPWARFWHWAA